MSTGNWFFYRFPFLLPDTHKTNSKKFRFFDFFSYNARFLIELSSLIIEGLNHIVLLNFTKLSIWLNFLVKANTIQSVREEEVSWKEQTMSN